MEQNSVIFISLIVCFLCNLSSTQYCNESIKSQRIVEVDVPIVELQAYKDYCAFNTALGKLCVFYHNVTISRIENEIVEDIKTVIKCCVGYFLLQDECLPYCEKDCKNGYCSTPGVCECNQGYTKSKSSQNTCIPVCKTCNNGICSEPGKCECFPGYKLDQDENCRPFCGNDGCVNGTCVAPNSCLCDEGFFFLKEKCLPYCESSCVNGYCSTPGVCECNKGFTKTKSSPNSCIPVCKSCNNGICTEPGKCECFPGYALDQNENCRPFCGNLDCGNGTCTISKTCDCDQGYEVDETGRCSFGVVKCPIICKGGFCKDGVCSCSIGMEWDIEQSACIPVCSSLPPSTTTEDFTVLLESTTEAVLKHKRDTLIWTIWILIVTVGILSAIVLAMLTSFVINKYCLSDKHAEYTVRCGSDQVLIQTKA